ncbi:MAG: hypothetical protein QOG66_825 [Methylobacteriaceae bacterium]|jgi:hypothetical protein|nr:hypothetical protein [Methylobacteriaceae bacterium]
MVGDTLNRVAHGLHRNDMIGSAELELVQVNQSATQTNHIALRLHLRAMDRGIPSPQIEVSATIRQGPLLQSGSVVACR